MVALPLLVDSVAVYAISTFMLLDSSVKEFSSLRPRKRRKRRGSIYFSSSKALKRSRMSRGRRLVLKSSEASQADVQRILRFKLPNSAIDEEASHDDVHGNEDASTEDVSCGFGERTSDVFQVSIDSIFKHPLLLSICRTPRGFQE